MVLKDTDDIVFSLIERKSTLIVGNFLKYRPLQQTKNLFLLKNQEIKKSKRIQKYNYSWLTIDSTLKRTAP